MNGPHFRRIPKSELPLLDRLVVSLEEPLKSRLFGCRMCGQCVLSNTGYVCPMGCPKGLRNGPCGGTLNGACEVWPEMKCVWTDIYDHRKTRDYLRELPPLQAPIDPKLVGTSSYLNLITGKDKPGRRPVPYLQLDESPRSSPAQTPSRLEQRLKSGAFALTCEIHSPKTAEGLERVRAEAEALAPFVDAVNATSNPRGRPGVRGLDSAREILRAGADPVVQICGRDVDAASFVAEIEEAWSSGGRNLLCLTGDWAGARGAAGSDPWETYFPMDAAQMIYEARGLRELGRSSFVERDFAAGEAPRFFVGGVINPYSAPRRTVLARLAQKVACGVDFIQTQIVLDLPAFREWMADLRESGLLRRFCLLVSVPLILSLRSLEVCASLPGVHVPASIQERLRAGADGEGRCVRAGLELAGELARAVRATPGVDGLHLMIFGGRWTDVAGWVGALREEVEALGERTAEKACGGSRLKEGLTTLLRSKTRRVRIRPDGPTVIIGERCNSLGYRSVREAVEAGNYDYIAEQAVRQVAAGAQVINVNMVGLRTPEREALPKAVEAILAWVDVPISLDFGDPEALKAALQVIEGKALINSINGEEEKLAAVLPIMKEFGAAAIAMTCDDDGIPYDAAGRMRCAEKIVRRAEEWGIPLSEFIFDCIAMGVATDERAGPVTFETMQLVRREFGANITLGASNISFGLPKRRTLDAAYLAAAITHGLNCPITDPTHPDLRWMVLAADAITGRDALGVRFIRAYREAEAEAQAGRSASGQ